jgi:hypothetical protein
MTTVQLHKRQWIITNREVIPQSYGFKSVALAPGVFLHYEPSLRVSAGSTGKSIVLGSTIGSVGAPDVAHYTAGQFVLIDFPWLSLDATGMLGAYYFERPQEVICSSSVALIAEISGQAADMIPLDWKRGLNWDPLPYGRIPGLKKLYCDQAFNLKDFTIAQRPRSLRRDLSEAQAVDGLATYLVDFMQRIAKQYPKIVLALTGGWDSRLLLSALLVAGVQFEAFTWRFDAQSRRDAAIAKRLCARYGIVHHQIDAAGQNPLALETYLRHTAGCIDDADVHHLIPGNYYRMFGQGDVILLGDVIPIGQVLYARQFQIYTRQLQRSAGGSGELTAESIALSLNEEKSKRVTMALSAWLAYRRVNPIANMDLFDTYYLDQRIGGWQASISQGMDCLEPDFIQPANSWTCIDLLMATSHERREAYAIQIPAMDTLVPGISKAASWNYAALRYRTLRRLRWLVIDTPFEDAIFKLMRRVRGN